MLRRWINSKSFGSRSHAKCAIQVIITSFLFPKGKFSQERLERVLAALGGDRSKLVLDLSCRRKDDSWFVAMDRWQTITEMEINQGMSTLIR